MNYIDTRIHKSQWWISGNGHRQMSSKILILLPESCRCRDTLTDEDTNITYAGHLDNLSINRARTIARKYKNTVYKVVYGNEECHCVCDVLVMHEMEVNQLAGLTSEDRKLQVERFHKTVESILVFTVVLEGVRARPGSFGTMKRKHFPRIDQGYKRRN